LIGETALEEAMSETPARFAVASFEGWDSVRGALSELHARGIEIEAMTFLGLASVLINQSEAAGKSPHALVELALQERGEPVVCSVGVLARGLTECVQNGATTLRKALGRWLLPRHAARIADAVAGGQILLWVQLLNPQAEPDVCGSLLMHSSTPVDVHDLLPVKPRAGNGQGDGR
jgi:hypothetical protein